MRCVSIGSMKKLTFITGNIHKAKYLSDYFHMPVDHLKLDIPEIQSLSLEEIVKDKAQRAYEVAGVPVLVEDVSLVFNALNELPGPLIKWFLQSLGNEGLSNLVSLHKDKTALATVAFALCDEHGVRTFTGSVEGSISEKPRGENGFGWDAVFIPKGYQKTWAEMSDQEKHETSMRKIALEGLSEYLTNN